MRKFIEEECRVMRKHLDKIDVQFARIDMGACFRKADFEDVNQRIVGALVAIKESMERISEEIDM